MSVKAADLPHEPLAEVIETAFDCLGVAFKGSFSPSDVALCAANSARQIKAVVQKRTSCFNANKKPSWLDTERFNLGDAASQSAIAREGQQDTYASQPGVRRPSLS